MSTLPKRIEALERTRQDRGIKIFTKHGEDRFTEGADLDPDSETPGGVRVFSSAEIDALAREGYTILVEQYDDENSNDAN